MRAPLVKTESTVMAPLRCLRAEYLPGVMGRPQHDESHPSRNTIFGRNLKAIREAAGLSQLDLIARSGVSNVKMIEAGRRKQPRIGQQKKLADALGVPVWRFHVAKGEGVAVPQELQQLMESPIGKRVTPEQYEYLLALPSLLGRRLSYEAYYKAFEMLEMSSPDPEHTGALDPSNED